MSTYQHPQDPQDRHGDTLLEVPLERLEGELRTDSDPTSRQRQLVEAFLQ